MVQFKKILGYSIAWLSVPLVLATFIGMNFWASQLATATGVKVSPWFTGGEVVHVIGHSSHQTQLHRPIFDGLLWEKKKGFVQIEWLPLASLPVKIDEEIDYDQDGRKDFHVKLNVPTLQTQVTPLVPEVLGMEGVYRLKNSVAVRINLQKKGN
jgi:hypothetical protein